MRYFQIMARIGSSLVHIEGPQDSQEAAMKRIYELWKEKPQFSIAEIGTTAVGFAEKKVKPIRRRVPRKNPYCYEKSEHGIQCHKTKGHNGVHSWDYEPGRARGSGPLLGED